MRTVPKIMAAVAVFLIFTLVYILYSPSVHKEIEDRPPEGNISLPPPRYSSAVSVEEALLKRRSVRDYAEGDLSYEELSQVLWAAQGITDPSRGFRTAPSAGALYPLEIYIATRSGVFHYDPVEHALIRIKSGDVRKSLAKAAVDQQWVEKAPVSIVIAAVFERTAQKYGERGTRYVYMEAGHAAQNIYLQSVSLGLGCVTIGAFYDEQVQELLALPEEQKPVYIIPIGRMKK